MFINPMGEERGHKSFFELNFKKKSEGEKEKTVRLLGVQTHSNHNLNWKEVFV